MEKELSTKCPKRVYIKQFPTKSKLNKILSSYRQKDGGEFPSKWKEGDMLWAKIRGFPFWPCMVTRDPYYNLYCRVFGSTKISTAYHVQFFGTGTERSWVNESSVMEFRGREQFIDIVQYGLEDPFTYCRPVGDFKISNTWLPSWNMAVAEAERAAALSSVARREQYTFQYVLVKGEKKQCVSTLMENIWKHSCDQKGLGENDNDDIYDSFLSWDRERPYYNSDDFYSSSDDDDKPQKHPVKIAVREGSLQVFLTKTTQFVEKEHPDWSSVEISKYLEFQWSMMSYIDKCRYTSRYQKPVYVDARQYTHQGTRSLEAVDLNTLDLQIQKLSRKKASGVLDEPICLLCEKTGTALKLCEGECRQFFHTDCVKVRDKFLCRECCSGLHCCFKCKQSDGEIKKCADKSCRKFYHESCLSDLKCTRWVKAGFICPLHACATCSMQDVEGCDQDADGKLMQCVRCPVAYHASDWCIVAGSQELNGQLLVCSGHFKAVKGNSLHSRVNLKRCFHCGYGGRLQLCQTCPAAYHAECCGQSTKKVLVKKSKLTPIAREGLGKGRQPSESWLCGDCEQGRRPLYGDIVWIKLGFYRWWPGEVCHPFYTPEKVQRKAHQVGEFPVRFFGSLDFAWIHKGRVYPFNRGVCAGQVTNAGSLDEIYNRGIREATAAFTMCTNVRQKQRNGNRSLEKMQVGDKRKLI